MCQFRTELGKGLTFIFILLCSADAFGMVQYGAQTVRVREAKPFGNMWTQQHPKRPEDLGIFSELADEPGLEAVFVGHDKKQAANMFLKTIEICDNNR